MTVEELIQHLNAFFPLAEELNDHLFNIIKQKDLPDKAFLLKAGHISENVYFIDRGLVWAYETHEDREFCSWFMAERDVIFSVESFYTQQPSFESIQCLEDSSFYYITFRELRDIYRKYLEFNFIGRELTQKYYALSLERARALRNLSTYEHYLDFLQKNPHLAGRVKQKQLACHLGVAEETLSRIINGHGQRSPLQS